MLIKALSDYYDLLAAEGKIIPDGYSNVNIHYLVVLNEEGKIEKIINWQINKPIKMKDKVKDMFKPYGIDLIHEDMIQLMRECRNVQCEK